MKTLTPVAHRLASRRVALLTIIVAVAAARGTRAQPSPSDWVAGTIVNMDFEAGRITIRHAGIPHLYLAAGETTFRYLEQRFVNGRRPGDSIRFRADRIDLELRLTGLVFLPR